MCLRALPAPADVFGVAPLELEGPPALRVCTLPLPEQPPQTFGQEEFGRENFGAARLGNASRTRRLVQLADLILQHPGGTLPEKLPHPKDRKAFYRLMATPAVTHAAALLPHEQLTARRTAQADGTVLLIHDATDLIFTGLASRHGALGQLGQGHSYGFHCHNSLAVRADSGEVLGLAHQILHRRPRVPKGESRQAKQARADREGRLW